MATQAIVGAKAHIARERTLEILEAHGQPEHLEKLFESVGLAQATTRDPENLHGFTAATIAALAEIIEAQAQRLEEQEARLTKLEEASTPPASTTKKAAKK